MVDLNRRALDVRGQIESHNLAGNDHLYIAQQRMRDFPSETPRPSVCKDLTKLHHLPSLHGIGEYPPILSGFQLHLQRVKMSVACSSGVAVNTRLGTG